MKKVLSLSIIIIVFGLLFWQSSGLAFSAELPIINGKRTVATVNSDPITLEELNRALASSHTGRPKGNKAGRIDLSDIMNRLINTRLIVLEANNMGLDELPEIKNMLAQYSRDTLRKVLLEQRVEGVTADEDMVERYYQDIVKEWKIKALLFKKEEDVKRADQELKAGKSFEEVAKEAVAGNKAQVSDEGEYLKDKDLTPNIARIVSQMEVGSLSPIVSAGKKGFVIFKLEGTRIPEVEDPEARKRAQRMALNQKRVQTARDYYHELTKKYVKLNKELLDELDYESESPGFEKLLKDQRVIVKIKREKPITVSDLSKAIKKHYYHGVEQAIASKQINKKKENIFEDLMQKRILLKEALRKRVDKTEKYKDRVKEYRHSLVFGAFVKKVVSPDIKLNLDELRSYYQKHQDDYATPKMVRIKSLAFDKRADAIDALEKLNKGTDFNWMSSHAQGRVPPDTQGLLQIEGKLLTVRGLPQGIQKAVSGALPGDFRLHESTDGLFYVLYIYHVVAPNPMPFEQVKKDIAKEVYNHKIKETVEMWAQKLKEHYPVEVYLSDLSNL
jgi:parvulin-like peptidyl-prolyl isomerase